jgi:hypothetical protein
MGLSLLETQFSEQAQHGAIVSEGGLEQIASDKSS